MVRHIVLSLLVSAGVPVGLQAQSEQSDSVDLRNRCRLAVQTIATTHPAPHSGWAVQFIQNCPEGGRVLANAFREARSSRDTALLDAITRPAIRLRDGGLFSAALEIAGDRGASPEARVYAIRTLMWAMYPGGAIHYADLADVIPNHQRSCFGAGPSTHTVVTPGETAMPADYVTQAKTLARRINADAAEPHRVRRAAVCLMLVQPWPGLRSKYKLQSNLVGG
jgi:hypothetical protein